MNNTRDIQNALHDLRDTDDYDNPVFDKLKPEMILSIELLNKYVVDENDDDARDVRDILQTAVDALDRLDTTVRETY